MNIMIIGGAGFIGSRLSEVLNYKTTHNISIFDKSDNTSNQVNYFQGNILNKSELRECLLGIDLIINLAAEHKDNVSPVSLYDDVNVKGSKNICEIADELSIKHIIFTSTVAVYGMDGNGFDENSVPSPFNDYGRTKLEAEAIYNSWYDADKKNKKLVIIRPTAIFGEGNRGNIYNFFNQISSKAFIMIGDGRNKKSISYVGNIAEFILILISHPKPYILINYVDKPDLSMNELANIARDALGKKRLSRFKLPRYLGVFAGYLFDFFSLISSKDLILSSIRIKKFTSNSVVNTIYNNDNFEKPYTMKEAINRTLLYEFNDQK